MKVVQFKDGSYGVRRWRFLHYEFMDLVMSDDFYWLDDPVSVWKWCRTADRQYAENKMKKFLNIKKRDYGKPVE